ncbi:hypothetical protein B0H19DRAFT_1130709 [Mycena capillaripes]|nr:hypothetical protein B0H19DRAFT_1130709 [Mycena capillaripes]
MPRLIGENITISDGLQGQDDHFETLMRLWEDLQLSSFDGASQPDCDFLSFAQTAFFFGIITVNKNAGVSYDRMLSLERPEPDSFTPWTFTPETSTAHQSTGFSLDGGQEKAANSNKYNPFANPIDDAILEDLVNFKTPIEWPNHQTTYDNLNCEGVATNPQEWDITEKTRNPEPIDSHLNLPHGTTFHESGCSHQFCLEKKNTPGLKVPENVDDIPVSEWPVTRPVSSVKADTWNWITGSMTALNAALAPARAGPSRDPGVPDALSPRSSRIERYAKDFHSSKITPFGPRSNSASFSTVRTTAPRQATNNELQVGELNIGIILNTAHRGKGYAREAIQLMLKHAFDDRHCHRIQASLLSLSSKDRMISLLTQQRFGHEGTRRRAFFNPMIGEWQDVTILAILDTDWAMRGFYKPAPKSLWDELFLRHERERDELLRWEEHLNRLKRTASMETIRAPEPDLDSDAASAASRSPSVASRSSSVSSRSSSVSKGKGKKRLAPLEWNPAYDGSGSDLEDELNPLFVRRRYSPDAESHRSGAASPTLSEISLESVPRSVISIRSTASAPSDSGSDWDLMESSSSASSSFGDDD